MTIGPWINVCTPFSHCEKTKTSVLVFLLFCFWAACTRACVCTCICMHVYVPGCCCGGTVARTNHYLVVAGLERSAVWNVRLCSTGARCSRALLKCPIKEGRARFEWVCVWECVFARERDSVFVSNVRMQQSYIFKVHINSITVCESFPRVANECH